VLQLSLAIQMLFWGLEQIRVCHSRAKTIESGKTRVDARFSGNIKT
jgi:hypothetical protein